MNAPRDLAARLSEDRAWLLALARALTRNDDDAEDLVQQVQLAALRRAPRIDAPLRGWLARALRNFLANQRRDQAARRERETAHGAPREPEDPARRAEEADLQSVLLAAVLALEEPLRSTVFERYYKGRSAEEIARIQGVPPPTVRARIARGLELIRDELDRKHPGGRTAWMSALVVFVERGRPELLALSSSSGGGLGVLHGLLIVAALTVAAWWIVDGTVEPETVRASPLERELETGSASTVVPERALGLMSQDAGTDAPTRTPIRPPSADDYVLRGRILGPTDRPLVGATIRAEHSMLVLLADGIVRAHGGPRERSDLQPATTDERGEYELRIPLEPLPANLSEQPEGLLRALHVEFLAEAPGHAPTGWNSTLVPGERGTERTERLAPAKTVTGRVLDTNGSALAGVRVRAAWPELLPHQRSSFPWVELQASLPLATTTTDEKGRYRLTGIAATAVRVFADHEKYEPRATELLELEPTGELEIEDIELRADRAWIRGRVLDANGRPVPGATIAATPTGNGRRSMATAGEDGSFHVALDSEGEHELVAWGTMEMDGRAVERSVASTRSDVELVVRPTRAMSIRVRTADGGAISRGFVFVQPRGGGRGRHFPILDQAVSLEKPPFAFEVSTRAEDFLGTTLGVDDPSTSPDEIELVLTRNPMVRGRVVDRDGLPVPHVDVRLFHPVHGQAENELTQLAPGTAPVYSTTDAGGGFALARVPGLAWQVRAELRGVAAGETRVIASDAPESRVEIELHPLGALSVRVVSGPEEEASGTWLAISRGDGWKSSGRTNAEGLVRFEECAAGVWWIELQQLDTRMGLRRAGGPASQSTTCVVEAGRTTEVVVDLGRAGHCVLRAKLHVEGAMHQVWTVASSAVPARINHSKLTAIETDGSFSLEFGAPGPDWIGARSENLDGIQQELRWPVHVEARGAEKRLTIASTSARIANPSGGKATWVHRWRGEDGVVFDTQFRAPEAAEILELRLPSGAAALYYMQPNGRVNEEPTLDLELSSGSPARIELPAPPDPTDKR